MVVTNPETGEIQALIGSRDPRFAGFNRALDAVRPIGSLIKPAVYLTALERPSKYTLTTWVQDEPFAVKGQDGQVWRPQNYDRRSHGTIFLYQGLANSYNLSTAKLGLDVGVPNVLQTVARLGINRDWPAYPSMLLGAGSLSPMEVATMYQTIASGGFNTPLRGSAASSLPTASRSSAIRSRSNSASTRAPSTWCRTPCNGSCAKAPGVRCTVNCRRR